MTEREPALDESTPIDDSERKKRTTRLALTLAGMAAAVYLLYIGYFVGTALRGG
ncbi:MAG: hypothetical protein AAF610_01235 [Pseudomonadota bacterium]